MSESTIIDNEISQCQAWLVLINTLFSRFRCSQLFSILYETLRKTCKKYMPYASTLTVMVIFTPIFTYHASTDAHTLALHDLVAG